MQVSYSIDSAYSEFVRGFPLRDEFCLSVFTGGVFGVGCLLREVFVWHGLREVVFAAGSVFCSNVSFICFP